MRCRRICRYFRYGPHFGEEPPLVGKGGSGTIFFAFCSLRCVFCQNYATSRGTNNHLVSSSKLSEIMLALQKKGCENINLVTPSHYVAQIFEALQIAAERGVPRSFGSSTKSFSPFSSFLDFFSVTILFFNIDTSF